ncbi:MAG: DUF3052 family protein [Candidatus Melainabacteria bacterium]|nr:DUF3052 family protein [Candidatus Melainabacteria bacterium]
MKTKTTTKTIQEKLQVKAGRSILVLNQPDGYHKLFGELPATVIVGDKKSKYLDIIQVFISSQKQLENELPKLKKILNSKGMIWVTYAKGTSKLKSDLNRDSIAEYAESIGLEGVAIVSIDDDWSALRLKVVV